MRTCSAKARAGTLPDRQGGPHSGEPPSTSDTSTSPDEQLIRMSTDAPPHSLVV